MNNAAGERLDRFYRACMAQSMQSQVITLERMQRYLSLLDNPEQKLTGIIVAGTNGKGSTSATLQALISAAGMRVGLYSSPHLVSHAERFRIQLPDGTLELMSYPQFIAIVAKIMDLTDARGLNKDDYPSWFELLTLVAFVYFAEQAVDLVILEVGLGGRLDATNVRAWPYQIITQIALDHTAVLGKTIGAIAAEKAAIMHEGLGHQQRAKVVTGATGEALEVIRQRARVTKSRLKSHGSDFDFTCAGWDLTDTAFAYTSQDHLLDGNYVTPLIGHYQANNSALALAMMETLFADGMIAQTHISDVKAGFNRIHWPGRMEIMAESNWSAEKGLLILDGAHNPDGMSVFVATIRPMLSTRSGKVRCLFAAKQGKNVREMLDLLGPTCDEFYLCPIHEAIPSSLPEHLKDYLPGRHTYLFPAPQQALQAIESQARKADTTLVCGSLYLLGEVKKLIQPAQLWLIDDNQHNADARIVW